ncbi:hypothetical protein BACCIP111895_00042 [Neobacillus rhizosphaerae]|uniref:BIG2 domain-containing protein n=1 Tax=Neobacillus rhizosphaerae TaxID=2880965 RepID=A0ABM9EK16_9BACI|nr:Ig-like domain-containing protein [Neobacillus rhizosphaerae]CAH2712909.1 hypothetical protein BACCIP111895_00042 [Neobacillus rhizosphaerae]
MKKILVVLSVLVMFLSTTTFNLSGNKVEAATIGQKLSEPEAGWKRYDDSNPLITYRGIGWVHSTGQSGYYNGTRSYGNLNKYNRAFLNFKGTKIRLILDLMPVASSDCSISIDGGPEEPFSSYSETNKPMTLAYEKTDLPDTEHTVVITGGTTNNYNIMLDAIDIDETGELLPTPTLVGDKLTSPESGWKRYDDTNPAFKYDSDFIYNANNVNAYNGGYHQNRRNAADGTYKPNMKVKFLFEGTKIRIISIQNNNTASDDIKISIDGEIFSYSNLYSSTITMSSVEQALSFEKTGLSKGIHTVEMWSESSKFNSLDAVDIDSDGLLLDEKLIESLQLNKNSLELKVGSSESLVASITPDNVTNKKIKWTSSNPEIASVDENGNVIGVKPGNVTITATTTDGSNLSPTCEVTVTDTKVESLQLNKNSLELKVGSSESLVASITPDDATNKKIKWTSSNPEIASVDDNGNVIGLKPGNVTITATTTDGSNLSATCEVTVTDTKVDANRGILKLTTTTGDLHEYDLSMDEIEKFINWIDGRDKGEGKPYYTFRLNVNVGNIEARTEYIMYDKIVSFVVDEYTLK